MKIGILQTGHSPDQLRPTHGDYDGMFRNMLDGHGFVFTTYSVVDGEFPSGADAEDGWIITGSRHGAYEDLPWIAPLEALIRDIRDSGKPLAGICFGHQIVAQALGGKVEKYAGGWSVGPTVYDTPEGPITLNAWHQDQVTVLPQGARVEAGNAFCRNAIVSYGDRIWTVQPHPEYGNDFIGGLIRTRGKGVVPEPVLADATARLDKPVNSDIVAARIAALFNSARVS